MKRIYLVLFLLFSTDALMAQIPTIDWGLKLGMSQTSMIPSFAEGRQTVTDGSGNIYTVGFFSGSTSDLDPGVNTVSFSSVLSSGGNATEDIIITKHNSAGGLVWARQFGAEYTDKAFGVVTDGFNIYVTGIYSGTVDFDPGAGTTNLTGANDAFILKLNSSGDLMYAKSVGGSGYDQGNSIDVDIAGGIVVAGSFAGTADFDPGVSSVTLNSLGSYDVFILKLDNTGSYVWVKQLEGDADDYPSQVVLDGNNNVLVTGNHNSSNIDLDPGLGVMGYSSNGQTDIYWVKLNSSGDYVWGRSAGGLGGDFGRGIATDGLGNIYATGTFAGNSAIDFGAGNTLTSEGYADTYVMRMDTSGNIQWLKSIAGSSGEFGMALTLDIAANIYVTGYFMGPTDFDMDTAHVYLNNDPGGDDMFVAKYNSSGNYIWARKLGGSNSQTPYSISLDPNADLITTGGFALELNLDSSLMYHSGPPNCIGEFFLVKLSQPVNTSGIEDDHTSLLKLYPNPASNYIILETENISGLSVYNSLGNIIMTKNIYDNITQLDISNLTPGMYFIRTNTGKALRFIKE